MRAPRTLVLYLSREVLQYGALAFVAITTILVSQNLLRRLDDLVVVGFSGSDLARVLAHLVPMLVTYATPIAFLFGVALAVSRLSADSEILAMRASGLGLRHLLAGPVALSLLVAGLTAWLMWAVEPQAQRQLRTMLKSVAARGGVLEAGKFRDILGRVIFVEARDHENRLHGIMIEDKSDPQRPFLIFAEQGRLVFDEDDEAIRIRLENGAIHLDGRLEDAFEGGVVGAGAPRPTYQRVDFQGLLYRFDVSGLLSGRSAQYRPREMGMRELRENVALLRAGGPKPIHLREDDPVEYEVQIQRRFALPLAPVFFALVAAPLGLRRGGSARAWGVIVAVSAVFAYYSLLSFGEFVAREGWLPTAAALWMPNAALGAAAFALLRRAGGRQWA